MFFFNNFLYVCSIINAPNGAVIKMDKTATVNTICPHPSPAAKGTDPIAACTVAFGQYAIIQNNLSVLLNDVFNKQIDTFNKLGYKAKINTHTTSYIN